MINFRKVEQSVRQLKHQVATGLIDQKTLETRMLAMVDIAADGYYWMLGHETETWYQHDGQQWVAKDPGNLRLLSPLDDNDNASKSVEDIRQPPPSPEQTLMSEWQSINWSWFVASLILIILIGWIVFASSLV